MFKIYKLYSPEEYGGGGTTEGDSGGGGESPSAGSEGPGGPYGGGEGPQKDDELVGSNVLSAGYSGESNLTKNLPEKDSKSFRSFFSILTVNASSNSPAIELSSANVASASDIFSFNLIWYLKSPLISFSIIDVILYFLEAETDSSGFVL